MGEFDFIERLLKPLAASFPGALGLVDDAALVTVPTGCELVIAKDAMVEGVHFLPDDPPASVAGKLLRVNLSDLAAMGAEPLGYLTVIARSPRCDDAWLFGFVRGLKEDQALFGCHLLGGDTVSTPGPLSLSLTILGTVPQGAALRRGGAVAGDRVWVSGELGDAAMGLRILQGLAAAEDDSWPLIDRYRTPRPRLALGVRLRGLATSAIDVSDGLIADLGHIAAVSGVGATIEVTKVPLSRRAAGLPGAREAALSGGDDYELLFTAPPSADQEIAALAAELALPLTAIGEMTSGDQVRVLDAAGAELPQARSGWRHF